MEEIPAPPLWLILLVAVGAATLIAIGGPRLRERLVVRNAPPPSTASAIGPAEITLPNLFAAQGARIVVVGPEHSGKSTVLHSLLQRALRDPSFSTRILLDGKGRDLAPYAQLPGVIYHDATELDAWVNLLRTAARELPARYQQLLADGKRKTDPGSPRSLIVIDDVEQAIRQPQYGPEIAAALQLIAEEPEALADVLLVAVQSDPQRLSRDLTFNANAMISLRSSGTPGAFTLRDSVSGLVEATGQTRYVGENDVITTVLALSKAMIK